MTAEEGHWTHVMPGEHVYDGVLYAGTVVPEVLDRIKSCDFQDDDIILATYAKSGVLLGGFHADMFWDALLAGTLWMVEMMSLVMRDGDAEELHLQPLPSRIPFIEIRRTKRGRGGRGNSRGCTHVEMGRGGTTGGHGVEGHEGHRVRGPRGRGGQYMEGEVHGERELTKHTEIRGRVMEVSPNQDPGGFSANIAEMEMSSHPRDTLDRFLSSPSPRMGRTHLPWPFFQRTLEQRQTKFVVVLRNVFDVAVSYFHYYTDMVSLGSFQGGFSEFFHMFINGHVMYGSWFDWCVNWWVNCKDNPNVCFFFYEDMQKDLQGNIRRLAQFLGKDLAPETVDRIADLCTFDAMRPGNEKFVRKGLVGDWKNRLTSEQIQILQDMCHQRLNGTGLVLDTEL